MLNACQVESRPNKKERLINWVSNKLDGDSTISRQIVDSMEEAKIISESENGLKYHFSNEAEI